MTRSFYKGLCRTAAAVIAGMLLCLFAGVCSAEGRVQTIMIYLTGSDLETNGGAATMDLAEMLRARHDTSQTSVLVMIGGAKKWRSFPSDATVIYEVTGNRPKEVYSGELMNMGDSNTLLQLLEYGYQHYPAESYSLILWDHGGGPLEGVCYDENFKEDGRNDSLSMLELQDALERSAFKKEKLEWIGFDACLMASVETASVCAPYARYMIASQEVEPGSGWDYGFLKKIESGATGDQAGRIIADSYYDSLSDNQAYEPFVTLSCVDLSRMDAVCQSMDRVFEDLTKQLTEQSYSSIVRSHHQAAAVGRSESASANYDLVDLLGLTMALECDPSHRQELQTAVSESLVYTRSNTEGLNGLSVYFPYYNQHYYQTTWKDKYARVAFSENYLSFLEQYCGIWLGTELADWGDSLSARVYKENGKTGLVVELTQDQMNHLSSAKWYALEELSEDRYLFAGINNNMTLDSDSLTSVDREKILIFTDQDGNSLSGCVEYQIVDDLYVINAVLLTSHSIETANSGQEGAFTHVRINCLPPDENGYLKIVSITDRTAEGELPVGKREYHLEDYGCLVVTQNMRLPVRKENGQLLPFEQWTRRGIDGVEYDLREYADRLRLRMVDRDDSGEEYVYVCEMIDTQGRCHVSEFLRIENSVSTALDLNRYQNQTVYQCDGFTIRLVGAEAVNGTVENGLKFRLELSAEENVAEEIAVSASISVNSFALPLFHLYFKPDAGARQTHSVIVDSEQLSRCGISTVEEISWKLQGYAQSKLVSCETRMLFSPEERWDISDICSGENLLEKTTLCSAEDEFGMKFSLKQMEGQPSSGDVILTLLAENSSEQERYLWDYAVLTDGILRKEGIYGYCEKLASGEKTLVDVKLQDAWQISDSVWRLTYQRQTQGRFDMFETNLIHEIQLCNTSLSRGEDGNADMSRAAVLVLPKPFSYAEVRGSEAERLADTTADNDQYFDLSICYAEIFSGSLYLDVCIENVADIPAAFQYKVNGVQAAGEFCCAGSLWPIRGMDTMGTICAAISEMDLSKAKLTLEIECANPENGMPEKLFGFVIPIKPDDGDQKISVDAIHIIQSSR